jgi:hypothetical protein
MLKPEEVKVDSVLALDSRGEIGLMVRVLQKVFSLRIKAADDPQELPDLIDELMRVT